MRQARRRTSSGADPFVIRARDGSNRAFVFQSVWIRTCDRYARMRVPHGSNRHVLFPFASDLRHKRGMTTHACGMVAPIPWELLADELPAVFSAERERRTLGTLFIPRGRVREMSGIVEQTL